MAKGKSTIIVDEHGNINIKEEGFVGTACAERTAALLKGLGASKGEETKKPEFFRHDHVGTRSRV